MSRTVLVLSLGAILLAVSPSLAQQREDPGIPASARPAALEGVGIEQRLDTQVPLDLPFRDEAGRAVHLSDYFGKRPVLLALVYYDCPMLCTQVLNGLLSALNVVSFDAGREFDVVVVSFDPREKPADASAKKAAYLPRYRRPAADSGWHFLTGEAPAIAELSKAVGFRYRYDETLNQFAHASAVYILTPSGRISRYFFGIEYAPKDLRLAFVEASDGRIGTPVDQILLYCFHYDPKLGKYGAVIVNIVRLSGVATVVLIGLSMLLMSRRRRRLQVLPGDSR